MRILVEAFACQPNAGSETGYGWHYPVEFARRGHDVTVIATERWRAEIEQALPALDAAPRFVFVPRRSWPLKLGLGWTVGSAIQYLLWLGRIMPRKGLPLAVMALERLPQARLEIVDGGVDEKAGAAYERADVFAEVTRLAQATRTGAGVS